MTGPYFFTWSKQSQVPSFELLKAYETTMVTKEYGELQDLSSTSFHVSFGHGHPKLNRAIKDQLNQFPTASPKAKFDLKKRVSEKLINALDSGDGRIFYTVSGAESVENALKMLRSQTGKQLIAARQASYHGATLGALSVTGDWRQQGHYLLDQGTLRIPEPHEDPDASKTREILEKTGVEKVAGFCLETMTGGNGAIIPPATWWRGIQKICDDFDLGLILDEVVCGFYRTGQAFGFHHYDIRPDFICLSKSITGGHIPFGAVWVKESWAKTYDHEVLSCGLTNYGHPLGLACTEAVLDLIEEKDFQENLSHLQKLLTGFCSKLESLAKIQDTRHAGLLCGIDLDAQAYHPLQLTNFYREGLYAITQGHRLILAPALTFTPENLEKALEKLLKALKRHEN